MTGRPYAVNHQGRTLTLRELAKLIGVPYPTITGRWQRGDRGERLIRPSDQKYSRAGKW